MSEPAVVAVPERAGPPDVAAGSARRWWILGVVGLAQLMVVLDATIVNIALPSAQRALGFSNADRQWVVTAYSLAFGGLLLLGGRLSDLVCRLLLEKKKRGFRWDHRDVDELFDWVHLCFRIGSLLL